MSRVPQSVVAERKRRAWELTQKGWTETSIALELGISERTVRRYLTAIAQQIEKRLEEIVVRVKAIQLEQLHHTVEEAFQAWEASKRPEQTVSKKVVPGFVDEDGNQGGPQEIVTTRVRGQCGDPRFLREAREAMADIRALLGIKAFEEEDQLLTMENVQKFFERLPPGAQTAYLRLVEVVIGGEEEITGDRVLEEEPAGTEGAIETTGYFI